MQLNPEQSNREWIDEFYNEYEDEPDFESGSFNYSDEEIDDEPDIESGSSVSLDDDVEGEENDEVEGRAAPMSDGAVVRGDASVYGNVSDYSLALREKSLQKKSNTPSAQDYLDRGFFFKPLSKEDEEIIKNNEDRRIASIPSDKILINSLFAAYSNIAPDDYAKALQIQGRLNYAGFKVPDELLLDGEVRQHMSNEDEKLKLRSQLNQLWNSDVIEWLALPGNFELARDDIDSIINLDKNIREYLLSHATDVDWSVWKVTRGMFSDLFGQWAKSKAYEAESAGRKGEYLSPEQVMMSVMSPTGIIPDDIAENMDPDEIEQAVRMTREHAKWMSGIWKSASDFLDPGDYILPAKGLARDIHDSIRSGGFTLGSTLVTHSSVYLAGMLLGPLGAAGALTLSSALLAHSEANMEAADVFFEAKKLGLDDAEAHKKAEMVYRQNIGVLSLTNFVEGKLVIGVGKLFGADEVLSRAQKLLRGSLYVGASGLVNAGEEGFQAGSASYALTGEIDWPDVGHGAWLGFLSSWLYSVPGGAIQGYKYWRESHNEKSINSVATRNAGKILDDAVNMAADSKLRERAPDKFKELVEKASNGLSFYIDASAFEQRTGDSARQYAERLGITDEQFNDALESGTDLEISAGDYITAAAEDPGIKVIQNDLRNSLDPNSLSINEAESFEGNKDKAEAELNEKKALHDEAQLEIVDYAKQAEEIKQDIKNQLLATGRTDLFGKSEKPGSVSDIYATLLAARITTMASLMDMSPAEYYARFPVKIVNEAAANVAQGALNHPVNPDVDLDTFVNIVDINLGQEIDGQLATPKSLLDHIKSFIGKEAFLSSDSKAALEVSSKSKAKHLVRSSKPTDTYKEMDARNSALLSINDIVKNAVLIESHLNDDPIKKDILNVHRLYVPMRIGDTTHVLRVVAHETKDKSGLTPIKADLFDLIIEDKNNSTSSSGLMSGSPLSRELPATESGTKITIGEMLKGVKDSDGNVYNQTDSNTGQISGTSEQAPGRAWKDDFPEGYKIKPFSTIGFMQNIQDAKGTDLYKEAKGGDEIFADLLIRILMEGRQQDGKLNSKERERIGRIQKYLHELMAKHPDAILTAVHANEKDGINMIPIALAKYIGIKIGFEVENSIIQKEKVGRTGSGKWYRLAFRPKFDGEIQQGKKYILVDDVVTGGGSLSELRQYIISKGGIVVDMVAIGASKFSTNIVLSEKSRLDLESKYGVESLQQFLKEVGLYGGNHEALTESEARTILDAGTLDAARKGIIEARLESSEQVFRRKFQGHKAVGVDNKNTEQAQSRPTEGGSANFKQDQQQKPPRGAISFSDTGALITLFRDANKSTFLHEIGHYFLEDMRRLSLMADTGAAGEGLAKIKADFDALVKWLKVEDLVGLDFVDGIPVGSDDDIKRWKNAQEKFAAAFEKYLMEGKVPGNDPKLRAAFETFKRWLERIYSAFKNVTYTDTDGKKVAFEINDEVRGIMDRMLVTESDVVTSKLEQATAELRAEFIRQGMPDDAVAAHDEAAAEARDKAKAELFKAQNMELQADELERLKQLRLHLEADARQQISAEPKYQMYNDLTSPDGGFGIPLSDIDALIADKNADENTLLGELSVGDIMDLFGNFESVEEFVATLKDVRENPIEQEVAAAVEIAMASESMGNNPELLGSETDKAAHSDESVRKIAVELVMLKEKVNNATVYDETTRTANSATEAAQIIIENELVDKPLTNSKLGITATISKSSLNEMTNETAVKKSVSPRIHAIAVANIDHLFETAPIEVTHSDTHNRKEVANVHRLGTLLKDGDNYYPVRITVIEYTHKNEGTRIYSVEAINVEKITKSAGQLDSPGKTGMSSPIADFDNRILRMLNSVKQYSKLTALERSEQELAEMRAAEEMAEKTIESKPVMKAVAIKSYLMAERRASQNATRALAEGRYEDAVKFKRQELVAHTLAKAAIDASREVAKATKFFNNLLKNQKKMTYELFGAWQQIAAILKKFGFNAWRNVKLDADMPGLLQWLRENDLTTYDEDGGIVPAISDFVIEGFVNDGGGAQRTTSSTGMRNLSLQQFMDIYDAARVIYNTGRKANEDMNEANKAGFVQSVMNLIASIKAHAGRFTERAPEEYEEKKILEELRKIPVELTRVETITRMLDGLKSQGMATSLIYNPLKHASDAEINMKDEAGQKLREIYNKFINSMRGNDRFGSGQRNIAGFLKKKIPIGVNWAVADSQKPRTITGEQLLAIMLNWGAQDNRERIVFGEGFDGESLAGRKPPASMPQEQYDQVYRQGEEFVQGLIDTYATPEMWEFVQDVWGLINSYWPAIQALEYKMTGVKIPKVKGIAVKTGDGRTLQGMYYPIRFNNRSLKGFSFSELEHLKSHMMGAQRSRTGTRHGWTKERTKKVLGMPLSLSLGVIEQHINGVIHDLTHREAIRDVAKLIGNSDVAAAIQGALGLDYYLQIKPWLASIATPERSLTAVDALFKRLKGNLSAMFLGLKLTTVLGNFSSLTLAAWRLGKGSYRLLTFYSNPLKWAPGYRFALQNSAEMRERVTGVTTEMREAYQLMTAGLSDSTYKNFKRSIWWFLGMSERLISVPIWNAAYAQGMDMFGDHQKALDHADSLIQGTQNTNFNKELSKFQRSAFAQIALVFYTQMGSVYNMFVEEMHRTGKAKGLGKTPALARMAAFCFVAFTFQNMLNTWLKGQAPIDDDDDDEKKFNSFVKWAVQDTVLGAAKTVPLIGDVASSIVRGGRSYNPMSTAEVFLSVGRLGNTLMKSWEKTGNWENKDSYKLLESSAETAGLAFGLPTKQLIQWLYAFQRWAEERPDFSPAEFVFGSPRKR